jgi:hypothetical protein
MREVPAGRLSAVELPLSRGSGAVDLGGGGGGEVEERSAQDGGHEGPLRLGDTHDARKPSPS